VVECLIIKHAVLGSTSMGVVGGFRERDIQRERFRERKGGKAGASREEGRKLREIQRERERGRERERVLTLQLQETQKHSTIHVFIINFHLCFI